MTVLLLENVRNAAIVPILSIEPHCKDPRIGVYNPSRRPLEVLANPRHKRRREVAPRKTEEAHAHREGLRTEGVL